MNIKDWPCWAKVGAGVMLAIFVLNWPSGSEWAAWVQAFGSIEAIVMAVYVVRLQPALDREKFVLQQIKIRGCYVRAVIKFI